MTKDARLQDTLAEAKQLVADFEAVHMDAVTAPLMAELESLEKINGGGPDGQVWSESVHIQDFQVFKDFKDAVSNTLAAVDRPRLVEHVRSVDMVSY